PRLASVGPRRAAEPPTTWRAASNASQSAGNSVRTRSRTAQGALVTTDRPVRTAAIVAAGFGSRLNELTAAMPKGFLEIGGQSLVERSLDTLRSFGIDHVVIGTGFQAHF